MKSLFKSGIIGNNETVCNKGGVYILNQQLFEEAEEFILTCYKELNKTTKETSERIEHIKKEIANHGYYEHTFEELAYGAKMAWRNSNRCIGRLFWESLTVFDQRKLNTANEIKDALLKHIEYATNQGNLRPTITIFKQEQKDHPPVRIWNYQLIRYAGYETENGFIGDPDSLAFTKACQELGWEGKRTQFDVLPLVIQVDDSTPKLFEVPKELVLEVPLRHPMYNWFQDLHLKWYAVPIVSSMRLEIGGINYTAAPFNGWYMETEIGARDLADESRYNVLPEVGTLMGLDINKNASLWKDRALIEVNAAVLYSFKEDRISLVDHHTAAQQFKLFEEKETVCERQVTGNWTWLIPPVSPATTHIFHKQYKNEIKKPNFFHQ